MSKIALHNSDCIEMMKNIKSHSVDLILTDPPYNLGNFMKNRATNLKKMRENFFGAAGWDDLDYDEWSESMDELFKQSVRVLKPGGSMLVFMAIIKVETLIKLAEQNGLYYKTTGIWHKLNPMPRNMNLHFVNSTESWVYFTYKSKTGTFNNEGKIMHDFIETAVVSNGEKKAGKHPTQKPIHLMEHFISLLTHEDDVILDPFMGSGSTGVAAQRLNRNFIGSEISEEYYKIAQERMGVIRDDEA